MGGIEIVGGKGTLRELLEARLAGLIEHAQNLRGFVVHHLICLVVPQERNGIFPQLVPRCLVQVTNEVCLHAAGVGAATRRRKGSMSRRCRQGSRGCRVEKRPTTMLILLIVWSGSLPCGMHDCDSNDMLQAFQIEDCQAAIRPRTGVRNV